MPKSNAIIKPNLGLYFDRPSIAMDPRALQDGLNFRVKEGKLNNLNLGWTLLADITLNGPVMVIDDFIRRDGVEQLLFVTEKDIYLYDGANEDVTFLTPTYITGTAAASGTAVTGSGTAWATEEIDTGDFISFGTAGENDPAATWFSIASVTNNTAIVLDDDAGTVVDGPYTIRKVFTGSLSNNWSTAFFTNAPGGEDQWWATNGTDTIVRWNGDDDTVEEMSGTLGFTCKVLAVYKNMMLFFNLVQGGTAKTTDMINSDVGDPAAAGAAGTGLSEQFKIHGGVSEIVAAKSLGDNIAIYSKENVTIAQFTGDDLVFIFRTAIEGFGCIAFRGVADFGNFHEFIGKDSQYTFDGVTVKESNSHVWREIIRQQDPSRIENAYAHFDDENGDLIWSVPGSTDTGAGDTEQAPSVGWVEHYLEGSLDPQHPSPFSKRTIPFTAMGYYSRKVGLTWADITNIWSEMTIRWNDQFFFSAFPFNIAGSFDGRIYVLNTSQNANDAALPSFVHFGRRAVIDGKMRGLITRVYPFITELTGNLDVTIHLADHAQGGNTISDTQQMDQTLPEGEFFTAHYRRGRYIELEFGTDGPGQPWQLSGFDIDVKSGGRR